MPSDTDYLRRLGIGKRELTKGHNQGIGGKPKRRRTVSDNERARIGKEIRDERAMERVAARAIARTPKAGTSIKGDRDVKSENLIEKSVRAVRRFRGSDFLKNMKGKSLAEHRALAGGGRSAAQELAALQSRIERRRRGQP